MKVLAVPQYNSNFKSNAAFYKAKSGNAVGTVTRLFRPDLDWKEFTDFFVKHFKDHDKVQFLQFASSDGSEAFTQIITLLESGADVYKFLPIKAYDIHEGICKIANSGYINIANEEKLTFNNLFINFDKYFKPLHQETTALPEVPASGHITYIPPTYPMNSYNTYKVTDILRENVKFNNGDMFEVLKEHEDNSNSIILCRNVLYYLSEREREFFISQLAFVLKKDSLVAIGDIDYEVNQLLMTYGFDKVMHNVFMKL